MKVDENHQQGEYKTYATMEETLQDMDATPMMKFTASATTPSRRIHVLPTPSSRPVATYQAMDFHPASRDQPLKASTHILEDTFMKVITLV